MTNFFSRMAELTLGEPALIQPIVAPMFAPVSRFSYVEPMELPQEQGSTLAPEPAFHALNEIETPPPLVQTTLGAPDALFAEERHTGNIINADHENHQHNNALNDGGTPANLTGSVIRRHSDAKNFAAHTENNGTRQTLEPIAPAAPSGIGVANSYGQERSGSFSPLAHTQSDQANPASALVQVHKQSLSAFDRGELKPQARRSLYSGSERHIEQLVSARPARHDTEAEERARRSRPEEENIVRLPSTRHLVHVSPHPAKEPAWASSDYFSGLSPTPAPTINVTIGRVEVRAVMSPAQPAKPKSASPPAPRLSLDEYLRRQNGGRR